MNCILTKFTCIQIKQAILNKMAYRCTNLLVLCFYLFRLGTSFPFETSEKNFTNYCKGIFEKCECTDYYIYCNNQRLTDINVLQPYINTTVSSIKVIGNVFNELPKDLFGACSTSLPGLRRLDLANNDIRIIHDTTFLCFDSLEKLILNNNSFQVETFLRNFRIQNASPKHLELSAAFDNSAGTLNSNKVSELIKTEGMSEVEYLDLSQNNIKSLYYDAGTAFCDLLSLKVLNLSHNGLTNVMLRDCTQNLEKLDLSDNLIGQLTPGLMDSLDALPKLKKLKLDNNHYLCDCSIQAMVNWLNWTAYHVNKSTIICSEGDISVIGQPVVTLTNVSSLECPEPVIPICPGVPVFVASHSPIYITVACGLLIVTVIVVAILFRRRRRARAGNLPAHPRPSRKNNNPPYKLIV